MCGIAGYIGNRKAAPILIEMLRLLEYRGYDSVGIATMDSRGRIRISKGVGSIDKVLKEKKLDSLPGNIGIGHTRWSTHGIVSEENAHPHTDCTGKIAIVHNGVIQNYFEIKRELLAKGHRFYSETDTEVVAHLIEELLKEGKTILEALRESIKRLQGDFSIVLLASPERRLYFMKKGLLPLIIGKGKGEAFVASDVIALAPYTKRVLYLEDGSYGYVSRDEIKVENVYGKPLPKRKNISIDASRIDKGGFAHRMHKEIYDIPHFASLFVSYAEHHIKGAIELLETYDKIRIIGAGSSYHASLYGEMVLSRIYKNKHIKAIVASEFPNRIDLVEDDLVIAVSQSGETYDVLEPVRRLKENGVPVLAIVNRRNSELDRIATERVYIEAGVERAVAATKTFVNQVLAFAALGGLESLNEVPKAFDKILKERRNRSGLGSEKLDEAALRIAKSLYDKPSAFYLGRYLGYVAAKEGALKIKEVSYIHAESYPSGELKHGPLALISKDFPVILISYSEKHVRKDRSTYEEVISRGANAYVITFDSLVENFEGASYISLPDVDENVSTAILVVPLFLIAYHAAVLRGYDPDKPRNLAKSVTVE